MIEVEVSPDGAEPFRVKANARDVLRWEGRGKGRSISSLEADAKLQDIYEIAHIAAQRQGLFPGTLAEFRDSCDIAQVQESEDVDPTRPDPSAGPS
jgi:hypothetical protein